jgi:hypothetical protein
MVEGAEVVIPDPHQIEFPFGQHHAPITSEQVAAWRGEMCKMAQDVYDKWHQSDPEHGDDFGAICEQIASVIGNALANYGISTFTISADDHASLATNLADGVFEINLPPHVETGAWYTWKTLPDVKFHPNDLTITRLDRPITDEAFRERFHLRVDGGTVDHGQIALNEVLRELRKPNILRVTLYRMLDTSEGVLVIICLIYAMILLFMPQAGSQYPGIEQFLWLGTPTWVLATPLILKAFFSGSALYLDLYRPQLAWLFHIIGAHIGTFVWGWFLYQIIISDGFTTVGAATCVVGVLASIRIIGHAIAYKAAPKWA